MASPATGATESRVTQALSAAADRLLLELEELSGGMAEYLFREIPELGDEPELLAEMHASNRANVSAWLEMIKRGAAVNEVVAPPDAIRVARTYVMRGAPLTMLLRVYHLGHGYVYRWWLRALRLGEHPPEMIDRLIRRSLELSFAYVDAMSAHIAETYAAEKARLARRADAARAETARALLSGVALDLDAASRTLGYQLRRWHVAAVLWADPADDAEEPLGRLEAAAGEIGARLGASRPLLVPTGRSLLWSWWATSDAPPDAVLREAARPRRDGVSVALGEPGEGAEAFAHSHAQAQEARRIALVAERPAGAVIRYGDVELVSLLAADVDRARRFMLSELGPLAADDDATARLRATLKAYLEEGSSLVAAARRLGIHENTVKYRLRRCEELLGRSPADRPLRLQAAILLAETV